MRRPAAVCGARCAVPSIRHPACGPRRTFGARCEVPGLRCPVCGVRCAVRGWAHDQAQMSAHIYIRTGIDIHPKGLGGVGWRFLGFAGLCERHCSRAVCVPAWCSGFWMRNGLRECPYSCTAIYLIKLAARPAPLNQMHRGVCQ